MTTLKLTDLKLNDTVYLNKGTDTEVKGTVIVKKVLGVREAIKVKWDNSEIVKVYMSDNTLKNITK